MANKTFLKTAILKMFLLATLTMIGMKTKTHKL
jgi:hypothetical protein